jgi:hypothetical protein
MLQVDSQDPAVKCRSSGVLIIYHAAISQENASNGLDAKEEKSRGMY